MFVLISHLHSLPCTVHEGQCFIYWSVLCRVFTSQCVDTALTVASSVEVASLANSCLCELEVCQKLRGAKRFLYLKVLLVSGIRICGMFLVHCCC